MMNIITDHIDVWSAAQIPKTNGGRGNGNYSNDRSYGIKKLRELILNLAVRGKLVSQNANDEPASVLLEKIAKEKKRLIKKGKIKKEKTLPEIRDDEKPFELPQGWVWTRLSTTGIGSTGKTPSTRNPNHYGGPIPFVGPGQITIDGEITESDKTLTEEGCKYSVIAEAGDVLMVCIGGSIGKSAIVRSEIAFNQQINCIKPMKVSPVFLLHAMNAPPFKKLISNAATGSATPIINRSKWEELLVALPPLAEQCRIVDKVDELMALCDRLEQHQKDTNDTHQTLVATLLVALTSMADPKDFVRAWERISDHFDDIFITEQSIDQLKQTILQLAVTGKLVPQDPDDPPASELLKEIEAEKQRLLKKGKIKPLTEIKPEEVPHKLPQGWEWVRLDTITSKITDGDHQTPPRISKGRRVLSAKNVRDGYLDFEKCDFISEQHYQKSRERCLPETGDLLIVSVGGTIGRTSLVPEDSDFALVRSVALIKPLLFNSLYLKYAMDSVLLQDSIHARKRGGAQPCLYLSEIQQFLFSLPPLPEQHRIVTKIHELMALCDALKVRLKESQYTQLQLADSIVEQVVG
jgi:type I restriction enzyme S subunit